MSKTVFTSNISIQDAAFQAKMAGYQPIGSAVNKVGQFVVFARKQNFVGM